jgi:hypothetical protein
MLSKLNNAVRYDGSSDDSFEFSDPREALIFAQFTGSILPVSREKFIDLEDAAFAETRANPLTAPPIWDLYDAEHLKRRRYVKMIKLYRVDSYGYDRTALYPSWAREFEKQGYDLDELIFYNIDLAYSRQMDELFWEYIAGLHLRRMGFIVTRFPLSRVEGQPDLIAFKNPSMADALIQLGVKGCFLAELDLIKLFGPGAQQQPYEDKEAYTVVVEAESTTTKMYNAIAWQLKRRGQPSAPKMGYLQSGCFDFGYVTGPDFAKEDYDVGIISNEGDEPFIKRCDTTFSSPSAKMGALRELDALLKLWIARNIEVEGVVGLRRESRTIGGMLEELKHRIIQKDLHDIVKLFRQT